MPAFNVEVITVDIKEDDIVFNFHMALYSHPANCDLVTDINIIVHANILCNFHSPRLLGVEILIYT